MTWVAAGDPVDRRAIEFQMRPVASSSLHAAAHHYASLASSTDSKFAHIAAADKQKVTPRSFVFELQARAGVWCIRLLPHRSNRACAESCT